MAEQPSNIPESFAGLEAGVSARPGSDGEQNDPVQLHRRRSRCLASGDRQWHARLWPGRGVENPNATANVDSEDWLKLLRGELNPMSAVISGKLKIKGDPLLLAQFQTWFRPPA